MLYFVLFFVRYVDHNIVKVKYGKVLYGSYRDNKGQNDASNYTSMVAPLTNKKIDVIQKPVLIIRKVRINFF